MKTYGIGIIGAGFMGKTHTYNYVNMPLFYDDLPFKIKLVGICNRTLSKAKKLRDDFGYEFATSDYNDLLSRKDIDIIDVCTPNSAHFEEIMDSLKAEKNVYADKPLCITDEEANAIVDESEIAGGIHQMAFHNRFYPATRKFKSLMDDEFIGRPISFRASYYHSSNLDPKKPVKWKQDITISGGGVLVDMGSHVLDLIYHYLGKYESGSMNSLILYPERPDRNGKMVKIEVEDHVLISARTKNGAFGIVEASKVITGSNDDLVVEIHGSKGSLRYNSMDPNFLYAYNARENPLPVVGESGYKAIETVNKDSESKSNFPGLRMEIGWLRGHIACQYNFLNCVYKNEKASPSLKDGAYIQKVMNKLYRIDNKEKWIEL